jgi:hypothetical protein
LAGLRALEVAARVGDHHRVRVAGLISVLGTALACSPRVPAHVPSTSTDEDEWVGEWIPPEARSMAAADDLPASATLRRPRLLWRKAGLPAIGAPSAPPEGEALESDVDHSLAAGGSGLVIIGHRLAFDARSGRERPVPKIQPARTAQVSLRFIGSSVSAFALRGPASGKPLWSDSDVAEGGHAFSEPVFVGDTVYVLKPKEVVRRHAPSGRVRQRWALPRYLENHVRDNDVKLVADGERFALVVRAGFEMYGVIMTGSDAPGSAVILDRPMPVADHSLLVGDTLVLFNAYDGVAGAYDIAVHEPPLASLGAEAAVATVRAEMVGEERLVCQRLRLVPGLGTYWLGVAAKPNDPLWECALESLAEVPEPGAGPLLRQLAQNPPSSANMPDPPNAARDSATSEPLYSILNALAANDDVETSRMLGELARRPEPAEPEERWLWRLSKRLAREQLWRTGRTSELGFCPGTERSRHVRELALHTADGGIGSAHPLLFQELAADGSWCLVCQARSDTDGDGKITVGIGHHGDPLGDDVRPYLIVGSGAGWTFDEFINFDPTGRYVAVREDACLSFVDTRSAQVITVPDADLRDEGYFGPHRGAAFDVQGRQAVYLKGGAKPRVSVRDLATGKEQSFDPGPGLVLSARFDGQGQWIELEVEPSGRWPRVFTTAAPRHCRGSALSWSVFGSGLPSVVRLVPLAGGAVREGVDILTSFDDGALVRKADRSLVQQGADGSEKVLVPATCKGYVLHTDSLRRLLIVACAPEHEDSSPLWIYGARGARRIGSIHSHDGDSFGRPPNRVVDLGELYVDVEAQRVVAPPAPGPRAVRSPRRGEDRDGSVLAVRGDGALLKQAVKPEQNEPHGEVAPGPLRWVRPSR